MSGMNRMSCEYRTGYYHGGAWRSPTNYDAFNPVAEANTGYGANPFADHDYRNGYRAGANDSWWLRFRATNGYHNPEPLLMPGAAYVGGGK